MWRWIPTPGYGHYGGRARRCKNREKGVCPLPVDGLDTIFQQHDAELHQAGEDKRDKKLADARLAKRLWQYEGEYAKPIYGRLYRAGAFVIFKLASR